MKMAKDEKKAWLFVAGSFYIHCIVIGLSQSFGILFVEFVDYFKRPRTEVALINSLMTGLQLMLGPISGLLVSHLGARAITLISSVLICFGYALSYFASSVLFLCLSYGVLVGVASSLLVLSSVVVVNQHFEKRRSLANSLGSLGGGVGTLSFPPLLTLLISKYTWKGAMLITGGITLNCAVFGSTFKPPKSSELHNKDKDKNSPMTAIKSSFAVFKNLQFLIFMLSGMLGALAYLIPFNHIPDHVRDLDINQNEASWLISAIGISGMFGRVFLGWITDFECVRSVMLFGLASVLCGGTMAAVPHVQTFWTLMLCSVVFGVFIGFWMSIQPVVVVDILGEDKISSGFGFLTGFQGICLLVGSPLGGFLYDSTGSYALSFYVCGALFLAAGVIILTFQLWKLCESRGSYTTDVVD